ncbi:hypothetical protein E2C01_031083 [Portunus trituberculatus]|uniref:Uncharacterized protein n=1 Tax=Portunus trituberculatus TaxID=210409 RepID=A0A5B7EWN6_PORTR|nr:hypothetical protein [Portunus trituberculatus]
MGCWGQRVWRRRGLWETRREGTAGWGKTLSDKRRLRSMEIYGTQHIVIMHVTVDRRRGGERIA